MVPGVLDSVGERLGLPDDAKEQRPVVGLSLSRDPLNVISAWPTGQFCPPQRERAERLAFLAANSRLVQFSLIRVARSALAVLMAS